MVYRKVGNLTYPVYRQGQAETESVNDSAGRMIANVLCIAGQVMDDFPGFIPVNLSRHTEVPALLGHLRHQVTGLSIDIRVYFKIDCSFIRYSHFNRIVDQFPGNANVDCIVQLCNVLFQNANTAVASIPLHGRGLDGFMNADTFHGGVQDIGIDILRPTGKDSFEFACFEIIEHPAGNIDDAIVRLFWSRCSSSDRILTLPEDANQFAYSPARIPKMILFE